MATNKTKAKGNKAIVKANESALKGFPKAKLKAAFQSMATLATEADKATDARQMAAVTVCALAGHYAEDNNGADVATIANGWRDNLKLLTMELAVAGNRFAEIVEGKDKDKAPTAKLTGYGNNVASIAKGVIEFEVGMLAENGEPKSYREIRKDVEGLRAEQRRDSDPDAAELADAKSTCDDAWKELRSTIFGTGDAGNIDQLTETLMELLSDVQAQLIEQADLDKKAAAESEAEAQQEEAIAA